MKKTHLVLLIIMMVISFSQSAKAQSWTLSGQITAWHEQNTDKDIFGFSPNVRYNINKKWAVGTSVGYFYESNPSCNVITFAPYTRFTYFRKDIISLYLDGSVGFAFLDKNGFKAGINPGIVVKISKNVALSAQLGFIGYKDNYFGDGYGISFKTADLGFCVSYTFN